MIILEGDLKKILNEKQPTDIRVKYLNTVKIFIYLIVEFSNFLEKKQISAKDSDLVPSAGGKVLTIERKEATVFICLVEINPVHITRKQFDIFRMNK